MRDARTEHKPSCVYAAKLIADAVKAHGSRNRVAELSGISRRHLQYIERGFRIRDGNKVSVRMDFPTQVILEHLAGVTQ